MFVKHVKKHKPWIIGLTGGIASGKSTASTYLKQKGLPIIDSDAIVHRLYLENEMMRQQIKEYFGIDVQTSQDKKALAQIIYKNPEHRLKLNDIIHPYVFKTIKCELKKLKDEKKVIIDMPLLFEVGYEKSCDQTVLIYCSEEIQIKRLMKRDHIDENTAKLKVTAQMSMEEKRSKADIVIDNQKDVQSLYEELNQIIEE
jgi:dephospho-CoA kinase